MNVHERTMESSNSSSMRSLQCKDRSETQAFKSMDEGGRLLPHSMVHSREVKKQEKAISASSGTAVAAHVVHGNPKCSPFIQTETETERDQEIVEVPFEVQCAGLADAGKTAMSIRNLRPNELVKLLNSTALGQVINERQLHRHRTLGPWIESAPKRIDLLKYVAWLQHERSSRRLRTTQRRAMSEVPTIRQAEAILERQQFRCALSGVPLSPDNLALDHIVPVMEGGDFSASNAQFVTKTVNRAKHTMSQDEFVQMCRCVAAHNAVRTPINNPRQQKMLWD